MLNVCYASIAGGKGEAEGAMRQSSSSSQGAEGEVEGAQGRLKGLCISSELFSLLEERQTRQNAETCFGSAARRGLPVQGTHLDTETLAQFDVDSQMYSLQHPQIGS